jgi:hypothetical protein
MSTNKYYNILFEIQNNKVIVIVRKKATDNQFILFL